jgi:hypothetical protein
MFYVIERSSQLPAKFGDCFVRFIPKNDNYHPSLTDLSLVYIRPLDDKKGYILCIDHTESFGIDKVEILDWLLYHTDKLWVLDKKEAMHWMYPLADKLFDAHLLDFVDLTQTLGNNCISYYYSKYTNLPNVNCLIPISKHYEESEAIFNATLPTINKYTLTNTQFQFQNFRTTHVFHQIEKNGVKVDKNCFIDFYKDKLQHPEFNLNKGKIYTQYNLHTTTTRPSNTFNGTNYAALNKDNGERECYRPSNDTFIEMDFQGYHPRLIGEMVEWHFPKDKNTYEMLGQLLGVTQQEAKELTFKQLYGGVWADYVDKPFFKQVNMFIDDMWDEYQYSKSYSTVNKTFTPDSDVTRNKLFNYIVQSTETSTNVELLELVLKYLEDKKTKLVLYTYDAFLFDYAKEDGNILQDIINILEYPVSVKQGNTYHGLKKI